VLPIAKLIYDRLRGDVVKKSFAFKSSIDAVGNP